MTKLARALVGVVVAVVAVVAGFAAAPVANAHADLSFSTPEDGAALDVAPSEVRLTFSEELFNELVEVSILDSTGELVMATEAEQTPPPGTDVIVPWPADLPAGEYAVAYRVVSEDGHPVTGQVSFSYAEVAEPAQPEESVTPVEPVEPVESNDVGDEPSEPATPETVSEETAAASADTDSATEDRTDDPGNSLIGPLLIAGAVIVGIGVIFSVVMLARSRQ